MFLRNVTISDFRAFPTDFSLDLTPGPGVTLIVGQNGLGKSTFFEALEWCLTGEIKRLRDIPAEGSKKIDFLARRRPDGTEADRYGVELTFQPVSETRIARWCERDGAGYRASFVPDQSAVIASLKSPIWREAISDLGSYLRLTHFLSQSGEQRFAAQDSKQRWSALESPAGTERLNRVRQRLGNKGVTAAFNRKVRAAQEHLVATEAELGRWKELLERRENARKLAESGGAVAPNELLLKLELLWLDAAPVLGELKIARDATVEDRLQHFGQALESAKPVIAARVEALRSLDDVPLQWARTVDAGSADSTHLKSSKSQSTALIADIERIQEALTAKEEELTRVRDGREQLVRRRLKLVKFLEAHSEIETRRGDESAIASRIKEDTASLSEAISLSSTAGKAAEARRKLESDFVMANERHAAVRELRNLYSRWSEADAVARRLASRLDAIAKAEEGLEAESQALDRDRIAGASALWDAEQQLEKLRFQSTTIEAAVASIASVLTDQDTRCPLCTSSYARGELKRLAASASGVSTAALASAEDLVDSRRKVIRTLERDFEGMNLRRRNLEDAAREAESSKAVADSINAAIRLHPIISGTPANSSVTQYLDTLLTQLEDRISSLDSQRRAMAEVAELDRAATVADQARRAAESRLAEVREALTRLKFEMSRLDSNLRDLRDGEDIHPEKVEAELTELLRKEGVFLAEQDLVEKQTVTFQKQVREMLPQSDALLTEVSSIERRLEEHASRLNQIRARWQRFGLLGDPSTESLQVTLDLALDRQQRIIQCDGRHKALVKGYSAWLKSQEFQQIQQRIAELAAHEKAATEAVATELLEKRVEACRNTIANVQKARDYRDQTIKKLEDEAKQYTSSVLKPLDTLNKSFLRVFSCFSNLSVTLDAKTHQSSSRLEFILSWLSGSVDGSSSASIRHFLSEGQLSALSVSLLLSMSTAYRWSRWRALALDDPLQHNDLIHSASFIEVVRNLVRSEGYQVILSTHDHQLADFVRRKMSAAKVDCRTCQFLGTRSEGMTHKVIY